MPELVKNTSDLDEVTSDEATLESGSDKEPAELSEEALLEQQIRLLKVQQDEALARKDWASLAQINIAISELENLLNARPKQLNSGQSDNQNGALGERSEAARSGALTSEEDAPALSRSPMNRDFNSAEAASNSTQGSELSEANDADPTFSPEARPSATHSSSDSKPLNAAALSSGTGTESSKISAPDFTAQTDFAAQSKGAESSLSSQYKPFAQPSVVSTQVWNPQVSTPQQSGVLTNWRPHSSFSQVPQAQAALFGKEALTERISSPLAQRSTTWMDKDKAGAFNPVNRPTRAASQERRSGSSSKPISSGQESSVVDSEPVIFPSVFSSEPYQREVDEPSDVQNPALAERFDFVNSLSYKDITSGRMSSLSDVPAKVAVRSEVDQKRSSSATVPKEETKKLSLDQLGESALSQSTSILAPRPLSPSKAVEKMNSDSSLGSLPVIPVTIKDEEPGEIYDFETTKKIVVSRSDPHDSVGRSSSQHDSPKSDVSTKGAVPTVVGEKKGDSKDVRFDLDLASTIKNNPSERSMLDAYDLHSNGSANRAVEIFYWEARRQAVQPEVNRILNQKVGVSDFRNSVDALLERPLFMLALGIHDPSLPGDKLVSLRENYLGEAVDATEPILLEAVLNVLKKDAEKRSVTFDLKNNKVIEDAVTYWALKDAKERFARINGVLKGAYSQVISLANMPLIIEGQVLHPYDQVLHPYDHELKLYHGDRKGHYIGSLVDFAKALSRNDLARSGREPLTQKQIESLETSQKKFIDERAAQKMSEARRAILIDPIGNFLETKFKDDAYKDTYNKLLKRYIAKQFAESGGDYNVFDERKIRGIIRGASRDFAFKVYEDFKDDIRTFIGESKDPQLSALHSSEEVAQVLESEAFEYAQDIYRGDLKSFVEDVAADKQVSVIANRYFRENPSLLFKAVFEHQDEIKADIPSWIRSRGKQIVLETALKKLTQEHKLEDVESSKLRMKLDDLLENKLTVYQDFIDKHIEPIISACRQLQDTWSKIYRNNDRSKVSSKQLRDRMALRNYLEGKGEIGAWDLSPLEDWVQAYYIKENSSFTQLGHPYEKLSGATILPDDLKTQKHKAFVALFALWRILKPTTDVRIDEIPKSKEFIGIIRRGVQALYPSLTAERLVSLPSPASSIAP